MKTVNKQTLFHNGIFCVAIYLAAAAGSAHAGQPGPWPNLDAWQTNRLFQPTQNQRVQEHKGKVVIYDGLKDSTVDKAMDSNFDRIQNMMFIRTIRTGKTGKPLHTDDGSVQVEDDDC